MTGARIADAALQQIGTPFRLLGRVPGQGLDCVGLVAHCLNEVSLTAPAIPPYALRGDYSNAIVLAFQAPDFQPAQTMALGAIAAVRCASRQYHLMIRVPGAWVHAHAGLGRVVSTPDPLPWPILGIWQIRGEV